ATWQIISAMGLNPNDENWIIRRFDEYTAMLVIDGTPVEFVNFRKQSWGNRCTEIVRRLVPRKGDARDTVYVADKQSDWATENNDLSLNMVEPERIELDRKSTRLNSSHVKISYAVF